MELPCEPVGFPWRVRFPPRDLSLLSTRSCPHGPSMRPASPREIGVRELVRRLKPRSHPAARNTVEEGLADFDTQQIAPIVPDNLDSL